MTDVSTYVQELIERGLQLGASDIHIEPILDGVQIRFRMNGVLQEMEWKEEVWGPPLVSRLKLLSGMDIGERRLPQDGGFSFFKEQDDGKEAIDIRTATLPTIYGEKIVMRLLPHHTRFQSLGSLGMEPFHCRAVKEMLLQSQGMILIAGPTGCGKTTTMYAMLHELQREGRNVVSLEQPVEYRIAGVNQVQIHPRSGLSFHEGLRAVLRQDPDVILVGEIRDKQTAEVAVRAALTGHLIISTIHTQDTLSTIVRLLDMGIEPYLVSSAIKGVIAQRLIRRVCPACYRRSTGCKECGGTGFAGRTGIYEVLKIEEDLHPYILNRSPVDEMRNYVISNGFCPLSSLLEEKIIQGVAETHEFQLYTAYERKNSLV
ncbi:GspE/PulE family protein [Aneurinibacillus sp. Ricciae_BoGa-3]|uniref:GspE/PulE family protein n=1 Tax=Aneurinibacillus sp. Ricciae_BoGa-3 TaxID=3022697 RepID=UPI002342795B|nr:GspE/PulE family protein [Aneurinibacillus sp. Ricciae_BoGa-3]WCK53353.1 GspE/PulE family protein [Aneurinibacillus sp. Ricciae_BoGa-3]